MTLRKIAQIGHPVLRSSARAVPPEAIQSAPIQQLIDDMIETMRDANGAGIAAPQVHESLCICVMEVNDNPRYPHKPKIPLTILVNPKLDLIGEERFENFEGCLSVPNLRGVVHRFARVHLRALDRFGEPVEGDFAGFTAGTLQHEIDHLHGRLFVDRVEDPTTFTTWVEFERFHRDAFLEKAARIKALYHST